MSTRNPNRQFVAASLFVLVCLVAIVWYPVFFGNRKQEKETDWRNSTNFDRELENANRDKRIQDHFQRNNIPLGEFVRCLESNELWKVAESVVQFRVRIARDNEMMWISYNYERHVYAECNGPNFTRKDKEKVIFVEDGRAFLPLK